MINLFETIIGVLFLLPLYFLVVMFFREKPDEKIFCRISYWSLYSLAFIFDIIYKMINGESLTQSLIILLFGVIMLSLDILEFRKLKYNFIQTFKNFFNILPTHNIIRVQCPMDVFSELLPIIQESCDNIFETISLIKYIPNPIGDEKIIRIVVGVMPIVRVYLFMDDIGTRFNYNNNSTIILKKMFTHHDVNMNNEVETIIYIDFSKK